MKVILAILGTLLTCLAYGQANNDTIRVIAKLIRPGEGSKIWIAEYKVLKVLKGSLTNDTIKVGYYFYNDYPDAPDTALLNLTTYTGGTKTTDYYIFPDYDAKKGIEVCGGTDTILTNDGAVLYTGWYYVVDTPNGYKRQLDKSDIVYYLDPKPIITAKNVKASEIHENWLNNKQYFWLTMRLDKQGAENWSYATLKSITKKLAFILDNRLLQVVTVNSQMTDGITVLNRGDYSRKETEDFKAIIESEK